LQNLYILGRNIKIPREKIGQFLSTQWHRQSILRLYDS